MGDDVYVPLKNAKERSKVNLFLRFVTNNDFWTLFTFLCFLFCFFVCFRIVGLYWRNFQNRVIKYRGWVYRKSRFERIIYRMDYRAELTVFERSESYWFVIEYEKWGFGQRKGRKR